MKVRIACVFACAAGIGFSTGAAETVQGSLAPLNIAERTGGAPGRAIGFVNGCGSAGTVASAPLIPALAAFAVSSGGCPTDAVALLTPAVLGGAAMVAGFGWFHGELREKEQAKLAE